MSNSLDSWKLNKSRMRNCCVWLNLESMQNNKSHCWGRISQSLELWRTWHCQTKRCKQTQHWSNPTSSWKDWESPQNGQGSGRVVNGTIPVWKKSNRLQWDSHSPYTLHIIAPYKSFLLVDVAVCCLSNTTFPWRYKYMIQPLNLHS